jgi:predicted Zn-dependent peptidase
MSLAFGEKSLDVQRKVVCEEFKEHYINKPYGDTWKYLRELCYTQHPYQWMTIGKELSHIENAALQDVRNFFFKHYRPLNAILCVAGNITTERVKELATKWFEPIESGEKYVRHIADEPMQTAPRLQVVEKEVPVSVIMKAYHIASRTDPKYYAADVITEILSGGQSSRLYQKLVKENPMFSQIDCYHTGSVEKGLLVIEAKLLPGISAEQGDAAIQQEIEILKASAIGETELEKVKNKIESMIAFEDLGLLSRANNLAFYELLGDAEKMNEELTNYHQVTAAEVQHYANEVLTANNSNTLYYLAKQAS